MKEYKNIMLEEIKKVRSSPNGPFMVFTICSVTK